MAYTEKINNAVLVSKIKTLQSINGVITSGVSEPTAVRTVFRKNKSSVATAGYRTLLLQKKQLPDNDFEVRVFNGDEVSRVNGVRLTGSGLNWTREDADYPLLLSMAPSGDIPAKVALNELYTKLGSRARGDVWNLPIFLAEGKKTASMVVQRATHLVTLLRQLRRGNLDYFFDNLAVTTTARKRGRLKRQFNSSFGKDASLAAGNLWLETVYGWLPFMNDVYDASLALSQLANEEHAQVGSVRASVRIEYKEEQALAFMVSPPIQCKRTRLVRESRRGVWHFMPKPGSLIPGTLGLTNPALVVWELVPFSFVADWFLPIGDYLEGLDLPFLVDHKGGSHGFRQEVIDSYSNFTSTYYNVLCSGGGFAHYVHVERKKLAGVPSPSLTGIRFNPKLDLRRMATSVALLRQQLSRLGRG